jgi:hypothetical protein
MEYTQDDVSSVILGSYFHEQFGCCCVFPPYPIPAANNISTHSVRPLRAAECSAVPPSASVVLMLNPKVCVCVCVCVCACAYVCVCQRSHRQYPRISTEHQRGVFECLGVYVRGDVHIKVDAIRLSRKRWNKQISTATKFLKIRKKSRTLQQRRITQIRRLTKPSHTQCAPSWQRSAAPCCRT